MSLKPMSTNQNFAVKICNNMHVCVCVCVCVYVCVCLYIYITEGDNFYSTGLLLDKYDSNILAVSSVTNGESIQ